MGSATSQLGFTSAERAELSWLLESGVLGRSANLIKVLRYICEETEAGRADQIKEYSIAVEALGRKPDFDPQSDTIVRVTVHTLRKRLQDLYVSGDGTSHTVRIVIPPGGYGAQFIQIHPSSDIVFDSLAATRESELQLSSPIAPPLPPQATQGAQPHAQAPRLPRLWMILVAALAGAAIVWAVLRHNAMKTPAAQHSSSPLSINGPARILLGEGRHSYTDHSGTVWTPQPGCEGGENIRSIGAEVAGTEDSYLYDGGMRGFVRCAFRAPPGHYQINLYMAEPSNLEPAERVVNLTVNAVFNQSVDVVDRAGADHTATMLTMPGIMPENDGTIHLDFTSEVSPVNAIEILPTPSAQPLPLRIVAGSTSYKDEHGEIWLSDRYFRGGRRSHPPVKDRAPELGIYSSARIGNFEYALPAPEGSKYRVTLYFREAWVGQTNGTPGGVGSRVFNVYSNGEAVLKNFDILAEGHGEPVVKTIEHVTPTTLGIIHLQFEHGTNYPVVNAIELVPE